MNALRNQVTLIGNLGSDMEVKTFSNNNQVAKVSIATNQYYKNRDGELVQETHWHNIVAWGKLAENMNKIAKKGDQVMVQGKLTYRSYEDGDGRKHYVTEIIINDFTKMHKAPKAEEAVVA